MLSASIGGQCCHLTGVGFATQWSTRPISAPTSPRLQSSQEVRGGALKSLTKNSIIMMAIAALETSADLHTSVSCVEGPTPIPGALRSGKTMGKTDLEPHNYCTKLRTLKVVIVVQARDLSYTLNQ